MQDLLDRRHCYGFCGVGGDQRSDGKSRRKDHRAHFAFSIRNHYRVFDPSLQTACCGYGANGMMVTGYDCALIPGALQAAITSMLGNDNICGRSVGLVTVNGAIAATVCSEYSR